MEPQAPGSGRNELSRCTPLAAMQPGEGYSLRLRLSMDACCGELLRCGQPEHPVFTLERREEEDLPRLLFTFWTDGQPEPFVLTAPWPTGQRIAEVAIWLTDVRACLLVDGVLTDEEWPLGSVAWSTEAWLESAPGIAVEVTALAAAECAALPVPDSLPEAGGALQYWRPAGHNTGVGDCMPFWHDGVFHLFYLFDRRQHRSKHGFGAHQWAHASTRDLVHWKHHERAIPITAQWEGSICTGSVFFHDGVYYGFYSARMTDRSPAPLTAVTSTDGIHFEKQPPLCRLTAPYDGPSARDPVVFQDDEGLFHMLVTTSLVDAPLAGRGGCLAHLMSPDLQRWERQAPFLVPGYTDQPECADYFHWRGWYYLVFSNNGIARYRLSRLPFGPWQQPANDLLNCPNIGVPKTATFVGDRRLSVGFLREGNGYGGIAVFRELVQRSDGTLGTAFVPEMTPAGRLVPTALKSLTDGVAQNGDWVILDGTQGFAAAALTALPRRKRVTLLARCEEGTGAFGLCLKSDERYGCGTELRLEPALCRVGFRPWNGESLPTDHHQLLEAVEGLDGEIVLDVLVDDGWIDVCIGGQRTLIVQDTQADTSTICLFAHGSRVSFRAIRVQALGPVGEPGD